MPVNVQLDVQLVERYRPRASPARRNARSRAPLWISMPMRRQAPSRRRCTRRRALRDRRLVAISTLDDALQLKQAYPETEMIPRLEFEHLSDPERFVERNVQLVRQAAAKGARIIKMWFAPRFVARTGKRMDDPLLDPIFKEIEAQGLGVLTHVSDPDVWFERVYTDVKLYGTKADQYPQLEHRLAADPRIPFLAAHMGGDPEHLDHLAELLERYPNLYLDTLATKWIVRELGKQPEQPGTSSSSTRTASSLAPTR